MRSLAEETFSSSVYEAIIFDLDGTLIDSAPSILKCFELVSSSESILPLVAIDSGLIGPPLYDTLKKLFGGGSISDIEELAVIFKALYDEDAYKESVPYPGVEDLLIELNNMNIALYIATNKRALPTKKIITHLGWQNHFKDVYAVDIFPKEDFKNKASMIHSLIDHHSLKIERCLYIGDRLEDFEAARENKLNSILVKWGYGDLDEVKSIPPYIASSVTQLQKMISEIK
jgi:phosphoglycolate phosphatase